jgi:thiamine kinase-like enzyme
MKIGELLGIGNTAKVYRWGRNEVIKVFYDSRCAMNEARNAEIINNLSVRAPKYSGLVEFEGKSGLIYERIDGKTMLRQIEQTIQSVSQNAKLMAQLQFEIHNVDVKFQPNLKFELSRKINASEEISNNEKVVIVDILNKLSDGNALCHYDFHPDNIIISPKGPIIIDWMNVLVGSQAADVTRSSMMIESHALPPNAPNWLVNREYRILFLNEYLAEYFKLSGIDYKLLEQWIIPTLAARIDELSGEYKKEIKDKLNERLNR